MAGSKADSHGCCARAKAIFVVDESISPKLRPPPLLAVLFCLVSAFCFICAMMAFFLGPLTQILCLALIVFYGAVSTREGSAWERGYPSMVFLIPISAGTVVLAGYIGVKINVVIYSPYSLASSGREYQNVSPTARTAEYADAGILQFTADTTLDTSRSFGFKAQDFTYCVAPVVSRTVPVHPDSSGPKISFWAVGRDCCGNRRDFECDGAADQENRNALRVVEAEKDFFTNLLVPKTPRPMYLKAIESAKALHNLKTEDGENLLLVRWASDPEKTLQVWLIRTVVAVASACVLYMVVITVLWTTIHMYYDREIKRQSEGQPGFTPPGQRQPRVPSGFGSSSEWWNHNSALAAQL